MKESSFPKIVEHIRLPLCTNCYLSNRVANYILMMQKDSYKYLQEAVMYHMIPERRHTICTPRTKPRLSFSTHTCLVVVGGINKNEENSLNIKYLNNDGTSWKDLTKLPTSTRLFSAVAVQRGILITGGHRDNVKSECWLFDIQLKHWTFKPPMINARHRHGSVVHNEHVYISGGEDESGNPMNSFEMYDQNQQQWSSLPDMPIPLNETLMLSQDQSICVLSGISVDLLFYDTVWGNWEQRKTMPRLTKFGSAATLNNKIYVVGGYNRACMSYDMQLDSWTILTSPRDEHGCSPTTVWQGKIMVCGGYLRGRIATSVVEEYDPEDDSWSYSNTPLDCGLLGHHLLALDICNI